MKYTLLDKFAYKSYCDEVKKKNGLIDGQFVGNIDKFVSWRKKHPNNFSYYYNKNIKKIRKIKINKIKKASI